MIIIIIIIIIMIILTIIGVFLAQTNKTESATRNVHLCGACSRSQTGCRTLEHQCLVARIGSGTLVCGCAHKLLNVGSTVRLNQFVVFLGIAQHQEFVSGWPEFIHGARIVPEPTGGLL